VKEAILQILAMATTVRISSTYKHGVISKAIQTPPPLPLQFKMKKHGKPTNVVVGSHGLAVVDLRDYKIFIANA
jgi:hypothetical protein